MRHPSLQQDLTGPAHRVDCPCHRFERTPPRRAATREAQFDGLLAAFQRSGGVATGNEVAHLVQAHWDQSISTVARWIVSRHVLSFAWRAQTLLPLFQFERRSMLLNRGLAEVMAELTPVFDDWDAALWFAEPNAWLEGAVPADLLQCQPDAVLQAARVDRFIAKG